MFQNAFKEAEKLCFAKVPQCCFQSTVVIIVVPINLNLSDVRMSIDVLFLWRWPVINELMIATFHYIPNLNALRNG